MLRKGFLFCLILSMQKSIVLFLSTILIYFSAIAQYSARFVVTSVATRSNEDIYLSGTFNNWHPQDPQYKLKPFSGGRKSIVLTNIAPGTYAFKFSRGANKMESTADGRDITDRILEVNGDVSNEFTIAGWKDDYPEKPRQYTASPQVRIIDTAFYMPQLNKKRRIWIYLPKNYQTTGKNYPVLYMHDGQNLFNEKTAYAAEWGIDECLDSLQGKLQKDCIVVGIDNGLDKRINEYNPYDHFQYGKGLGNEYVDFLAQTLKPFIDSKYRTKKGRDYTYLGGSSMGGLISWYAMLKYPSVFGGAAVFSPSFWISPQIAIDAEKWAGQDMLRFYFYTGGKEDANSVSDMQKIAGILQKKSSAQIRTVVNPIGQHNEQYWRQEFPSFYAWMANNWKE